jgi:hypothetical protein
MIVIGLGTGRSGTASLATLLNAQVDALCFHEMNPSCVRFSGTDRPVLNTIEEFQTILDGGEPAQLTVDLSRAVAARAYDELCRMRRVRLIGDIAFYYLSYVEEIAARNSDVRFICLQREREATIESWINKAAVSRWRSKWLADRLASLITREPFYRSRNYWMVHDGSIWQIDPVWDKCFPKFEATDMRDAIGQYWDMYYQRAEELSELLPDVFRIVPTSRLGEPEAQRSLLEFCGIPADEQVHVEAHIHRSRRPA